MKYYYILLSELYTHGYNIQEYLDKILPTEILSLTLLVYYYILLSYINNPKYITYKESYYS